MEQVSTDVLIIGAGAAGLVSALDLQGLDITLMAKAPVGEGSSSAWAQGGIAAAMGDKDHPEHHKKDTLDVGVELSCEKAAHTITHEGPELIDALIKWGVNFDCCDEGNLRLGREAAHSFRRILHANGDSTGKEIMRALGQALMHTSNINVMENCQAYELIVEHNRVKGAFAKDAFGQDVLVKANAVVLATGGIGGLFGYTTNPEEACGEGLAMAAQAGARLADLEFVQFHPTAIDVGLKPMPLATEALRGEGAHLIDGRGIRFMPAVHKDAELAPRDVVARAIWRRVKNGEKIFLDATKVVGQDFPERFPTVWGYCRDAGLDPRVEPIPITPAAHYHMGGIDVDLKGRSSLYGLWAVGEVACTGVHGANRLASNSLLEAVVMGRRVAKDILMKSQGDALSTQVAPTGSGSVDLTGQLASLLYRACGVERNEAGLYEALAQVVSWEGRKASFSPLFKNRLITAKMILVSALERCESRGGHFRSDYPETDSKQAQRHKTTLREVDAFIRGLNLGTDLQGTVNSCQKPA
ncbi:L-aspartate oxidase [Candidatus Terasakiella magnetica]|uniref:L-aspartate oxidase n=1 Tax=Candidatus Terasakiella magnetica TaxID=1867952 RepID=A0A1C3RLB6_9PROT|nr:L-aspartate oxidase [Candidatus Terasakiella magnetica]SCA58013.1 L-aspartate oxidase [Candidatus Terasakiella magnetica]